MKFAPKWQCYKCQREAGQFSTCSFCPKICCDGHRRFTECCHWWKCEECSCYCRAPPPVSGTSTGEPRGDSPVGSLGAAQPKNTMPRYSGAQIRCSNEHGGKPEPKNDAWIGGVGAAGPGESTSHLAEEYQEPGARKTPPNCAMLPPNKITMPKKRAVLPAH